MKFKLVTDSCCDLPYTVLEKEQVSVVPMIVTLDGKEYIDDSGKTFSSQWLIEEVKGGKMASTSQINLGTYLETFKSLVNETDLPIIYLGFSSGLSGSFNNAQSALAMLKEDMPQANITLIDSKQACLGEGLLVMELITLRNQGASLEEAVEAINRLKTKIQSWVTVDDLKHLERGGRISKTTAAVGTLINIKPIIVVDEEGKLVNQGKVRGRKKSLAKLVEETKANISLSGNNSIYIAYAGDLAAAETVKANLVDLGLPIEILPMGATIASHTGYGAIAVFSVVK